MPKRVLIVDDNSTNRILARVLLTKLGWETEEVDSGRTALERTAGATYDLILLDISMPDLSGEETCAALRARPGGESQRIVAYTAHAFPEERARILAAGFDDILIKPVNMQTMAAAVGPGTP